MGLLDPPGLTPRAFHDQRAPGSIGQRIFGGRMGTYPGSGAVTFQVTAEIQQHCDAVRLIFASTYTRWSASFVTVAAAAISSASDLNGSSATWVSAGRVSTANAPATGRIAYVASEWLPVQSVARSDGGTKPLIVVRCYGGVDATLPVVGNGTDSFTNWAARTDGRRWVMREQSGDQITTPTGFTSTTNTSQSPIVGIQYLSRGKVINVAGVGDSITDGRGTYLGQGFILPACASLSSDAAAIEYSNFGWSGQTAAIFAERAIDILQSDFVRPDVLVMPSQSPNDPTPVSAAGIAAAKVRRSRVLAECARYGVVPVLWTMLPVNSSVADYGSDDANRVADNASVVALGSRAMLVADTATAFSGATDGDGQVAIASGLTTDNIHPNDAGNTALTAVLTPVLRRAIGV